MRVLMTGDRGFIGRALESRLVASDYEVEGFDLADGRDIARPELIAEKAAGCEAIIHLAALKDSAATAVMQTNLQGTWNVLRAGEKAGTKKILFTSSADVLGVFQGEGEPEYLPLDDNYPCRPIPCHTIETS